MAANPIRRTPVRQDPEAVAWLRTERHLSQRALAGLLNIDHSLLSRIEDGTRNADPELLAGMARALGCPVTVLQRKPEGKS
jgi:transcriptional regulator with XRE-family HTH domain